MFKIFALVLLSSVAFAQTPHEMGDPNKDSQWSLEAENTETPADEVREPASEDIPDEEQPLQDGSAFEQN